MKKENDSQYVTLQYVSKKRLNKRKVYRNRAIIIVVSGAVLLGSIVVLKSKKKNDSYVIPDNQTTISLVVKVNRGDTLYDIARTYYTSDCDNVYKSFSNFEDEIAKENNIEGSRLDVGDELIIPVIIDKDNTLYLQILEKQKQIAEIEKNNKWVPHTSKFGETISGYAAQASGSYEETLKLINEILAKNNMTKNSILYLDTELLIINPMLGTLKTELNELNEQLEQSLMNKNITK